MWWRRAVLSYTRATPRTSPKTPWLSPSLPYSDLANKKGKIAPLQERRMVDRFRLRAKGGGGGDGCWSSRRSRSDRHGVPDGGNGGKGGDVILECSASVWDFSNLQHHSNAKRGGHGVSKNKIGSRGSDKIMQVPVGTVIHLVSGEAPSFMENTSITSLHPWEIPDGAEANTSISVLHSDNRINTSRLLENGDHYDSPAYSMDSTNLSSKHHKVFGSSNSNEEHSRSYMKHSLSYSQADSMEINDKNNDGDTYNMELEDSDEAEDKSAEEEVQYSVAELTESGQRVIVARGGEGGIGNGSLKKHCKFGKNIKINDSESKADIEDDETQSSLATGTPGTEAVLILELKSLADVGLVGIPNAGKSTLLGAISRAKPAVGHYAFTTLRPNIGNLNYEDFFSVTVADIPGLIKGAHENRGLGHAFLRHIERTKVLVYVLDLAADLNGRKGIAPWEQLRDLVLELEFHREGLSDRPSLVVANKIDEDGAESVYEELKRRVGGVPIFPVCAVLEEGVPELKAGLRKLMDGSMSHRLDINRISID